MKKPQPRKFLAKLKQRHADYMARRPHRSLRLTRRRDIPKRVQLPGYIAFTIETFNTVWKYRTTFGLFAVLYIILNALLVGLTDQDKYQSFATAVRELGPSVVKGNFDKFTETITLFGGSLLGIFTNPLDQSQQIYLMLISLFSWLVIVWLLRQFMAGEKVRLRDGLYNAGAPFIATLCVLQLMLLQLLPAAIAIIAYMTASGNGVLQGAEAMAFGIVALLVTAMSLYWTTSSFLAAIIVTLPGTYPMRAIRTAGDLSFGRRSVILLRLLWLGLAAFVSWAIFLIPIILISGWLHLDKLPLVPVAIAIMGAATTIYGTSYIYLLYRKMIENDAA